jgi:hypothetical protein
MGDIKLNSHVFKDGELSNNLAGLSNLCNEGFSIMLDSESIAVSRNEEIIWSVIENRHDKLWHLDSISAKWPSPAAALFRTPNYTA